MTDYMGDDNPDDTPEPYEYEPPDWYEQDVYDDNWDRMHDTRQERDGER